MLDSKTSTNMTYKKTELFASNMSCKTMFLVVQWIFSDFAKQFLDFLFPNKFCVLFQGLEDSDLAFKLCKRRLSNSMPLLSKVGNRISRNWFANLKFFGTTKNFILQDILLAKTLVFICHICASVSIQHPCF